MSNRFAISVEGIDDPSLVADIEATITNAFHEMALPGSWRVTVRPSQVKGQWSFAVHGMNVQHTLSIAVPANLLPTLIPKRLRESLENLYSGRLKTAFRVERSILRAV